MSLRQSFRPDGKQCAVARGFWRGQPPCTDVSFASVQRTCLPTVGWIGDGRGGGKRAGATEDRIMTGSLPGSEFACMPTHARRSPDAAAAALAGRSRDRTRTADDGNDPGPPRIARQQC